MPEQPVALEQHPFLQVVVDALQSMDKSFVTLSRLKWVAFDNLGLMDLLLDNNLQERPYAYEFYHQMRKLWEGEMAEALGLSKLVMQAEVNKSYQDIPDLRKIPDFLVHRVGSPDEGDQFAAIEIKVASRLRGIGNDLQKLIDFQHILTYRYGIEVIIGTSVELTEVPAILDKIDDRIESHWSSYTVILVYFNVDSWTASVMQRTYEAE